MPPRDAGPLTAGPAPSRPGVLRAHGAFISSFQRHSKFGVHVSIYFLCFFLLCRPLDSCCVLCYFSHSSALRVYAGFDLVVRSLCFTYADVVPALLAQGLLIALAPAFATSSTAPLLARRPSPSRLSALSARIYSLCFFRGYSLARPYEKIQLWKGPIPTRS